MYITYINDEEIYWNLYWIQHLYIDKDVDVVVSGGITKQFVVDLRPVRFTTVQFCDHDCELACMTVWLRHIRKHQQIIRCFVFVHILVCLATNIWCFLHLYFFLYGYQILKHLILFHAVFVLHLTNGKIRNV